MRERLSSVIKIKMITVSVKSLVTVIYLCTRKYLNVSVEVLNPFETSETFIYQLSKKNKICNSSQK